MENPVFLSKRGMPPQWSEGGNLKNRCLGGEFRGSKWIGVRCCITTCEIFNLVVEGALLPPPRAGRRLCCGQGRMMVAVARCNFPSFSLPSEQISQKKIVRLISSKMPIESTLPLCNFPRLLSNRLKLPRPSGHAGLRACGKIHTPRFPLCAPPRGLHAGGVSLHVDCAFYPRPQFTPLYTYKPCLHVNP